VYSFPSNEAAIIALKTTREFLESGKGDSLELVVFCNFEMKDVNAYHKHLPRFFPLPTSVGGSAATKQEEMANSREKTPEDDDGWVEIEKTEAEEANK
jgi:hypothetical protein